MADDVERALRWTWLNAERDELRRLVQARDIDSETASELSRAIDLRGLRHL